VSWDEKIRSPHFSGGVEIDLGEASGEISKPLNERILRCPETQLPIRAEQLLIRAGLSPSILSSSFVDSSSSWWNFHSATKGNLLLSVYDKTTSISGGSSSSVADDGVRNRELFDKFETLFKGMSGGIVGSGGGNDGDEKKKWSDGIERVYAINNPQLRSAFEIKREVIERQHLNNPGLFRREGWRQLDDSGQRKRMFLSLSSKISQFRSEFNDGSHPFVVPMIHGTREDAAFRMIEGGFGNATATAGDDGYFGRGMYFTSDMRYGKTFAREYDEKNHPGVKVFLITLVIPGNPYPVTEHPFIPKKDKNGNDLVPLQLEMDENLPGSDKRKKNPFG
jgi:hypothetical protein